MRHIGAQMKRFIFLTAVSYLINGTALPVPSWAQVSIDEKTTSLGCRSIKAPMPFDAAKKYLERSGVLVEDFFLYGDCREMITRPGPDLVLPPLHYAITQWEVDEGRYILDLLDYLEMKGNSTGVGLNLAKSVLNRVGEGRANHRALDALEIVYEHEVFSSARKVLSQLREELCRRGGEYSVGTNSCPDPATLTREPMSELPILPKPNEHWQWLIEPQYDEAWPFSEGLAPVRVGFKWGYVNTSGNLAIRPTFDWAGSFSGGMARVETNGKVGFIDRAGQFVIDPEFDEASGFGDDGLSFIRIGGKGGVISRDGTYFIPPIYRAIGSVGLTSEGIIKVFTETGWGVIDSTTGQTIVEPVFDDIYGFSEGVATLQMYNPSRFSYIDRVGSMIIEERFLEAKDFSEGLAAVIPIGRRKFGYIDKTGQYVVKPQFYIGGHFSEGRAYVMLDIAGDFGYIDKHGTLVIGYKFSEATEFSDGVAHVKVDRMWGVIDRNGNYIVEPIYEELGEFGEGLATAKKNGRYGVVDQEGRVVVDFEYQDVSILGNGLFGVLKDGKWGIIDQQGRIIIEPVFEGSFSLLSSGGSILPVQIRFKWGFIRLLEE